jgi:hypothetical protein
MGNVYSNGKTYLFQKFYEEADRTPLQIAWVNRWVCPQDLFIQLFEALLLLWFICECI